MSTDVHRGLVDVVVDTTAISALPSATDPLTYRGYPVRDLAALRSWEEVAYLLWHGDLPDAGQLADFRAAEAVRRPLDRDGQELLRTLSATCHPMDVLRTAVSYLGAQDPTGDRPDPAANRAKALSLFAKLPTIVALDLRRRRGRDAIWPDPSLGYAENFFRMSFGDVPSADVVRAFDTTMTLYAEHSFNTSTFTARVITSTLSDLYSAVTGAIGALKGSLHGGANEAVMDMLLEIADPARVPAWLDRALADKRRIMGFGHRVYRNGDSRVPIMEDALGTLVAAHADGPARQLAEVYTRLRTAMLDRTGIHPNLDYPSALAYHLMGFDAAAFTPIFVMSRITGWTAHIVEQASANVLVRPLSAYTGPRQRPVPPRPPPTFGNSLRRRTPGRPTRDSSATPHP
ncbi:bifunctional 2-methylcitrate synthase/citrate synthase [Micromonospora sp. HUAS LYJ1]|uniref:bifunctional 2-methylcitrate synthase/citrate synthase n=1 Tax=Micromonospora sp. HUAS LYJ1 TaxID=3061626 RepID=UPI0026713959|nr:bifunctional 2-methylcitrate synthase/citrate synthase [Micromonospora sp. HUAS LYJ1]WKU07142.1 bifunctional 2-methylcitrate synthase/citrate synthase [Micromonospora sp. HUAS LYJ1]